MTFQFNAIEQDSSSNELEIAAMRYAVIIENAGKNFGAYVPDLPGCIAVGDTLDEVKREIADAIRFHIQGMKEDGLPIPAPSSLAEYVEA